MASKLKSYFRKFVRAPEERIPVVSSKEWLQGLVGNPKQDIFAYFKSLFPVFQWIGNYNLGWLTGDVIAGLTVGLVLIPQSMSYARIATLPTEYGLYSSFVGVFIYCFFATSKDVSIGPVAVMSLEVAAIIRHVNESHPDMWSGPQIATHVAFICGFIVLGIGLLRIGWIVEFIPTPAVAGFMTGSAVNIVSGQVPGLLGISSRFDTRTSPYKVIINTLKNLKYSTKDAAFGVTSLFALYLIRWIFERLTKRYPHRTRTFFFISVLRNAFILILTTVVSWAYVRHKQNAKGNYPINILKTVPGGFKHVGLFHVDSGLIKALAPEIPVATIILLLEHISISKSFGRLNGYKIDPNQELIAIGVTNTIGTVFSAYPATGSFSRSALKSKCGVRTPAAGWVTGLTVIVALYALTTAFYWISLATLSAIIIHAVADLVTPPSQVYAFWRISPLEFFIWLATVLVSIFTNIENGIYTSIIASVALLLIRVARPGGDFLGRVTIHEESVSTTRDVFVPYRKGGGVMNPHIRVEPPAPGVIVYRFEESFTFPNSSYVNSTLVDHAKETTRRGKDMSQVKLRDRPWNDPGPRGGHRDLSAEDLSKPLLRAVVLDFSAVAHIDTTGIQNLIDVRKELEKWADGAVEFHFANILSPWVRRALIAGGFGTGIPTQKLPSEIAPVVPHQNQGFGGSADDYQWEGGPQLGPDKAAADVEEGKVSPSGLKSASSSNEGPIVSTVTPFFHFDLSSAVRAAEGSHPAKN